jgi:acyl-CoA reductase-like NAD-dependent aldehyde dehydrogenase
MTIERRLTLGAFIGGESYLPSGGAFYESFDPSTEEVNAQVLLATAQDVDVAVRNTLEAQLEWMRYPAGRRGELIWSWTENFLREADQIALADTRDMGKVLKDTLFDVQNASKFARYWAGMADKLVGEQIPSKPGYLSYTVREPLGVCGVILPWNAPTIMTVARIAIGLACGNGIVIKPSELTPTSSILLAEAAVAAGMPAGLVNVVTGDRTTGEALVSHPSVKGVNFTGSVASGRSVATIAAPYFKSVVLELGGKAPNIVFEDADLEEAVQGATWGVFQNSGQTCCAATRLLVQRSVADKVMDRLLELTSKIRVGNPIDPRTHIGPLVSAAQRERVVGYVDSATTEGGRIVAGGSRPSYLDPGRGYYFSPTILDELDPGARVAQEEIFGPVLTVLEFDDEEDAIRIANDVEYGLTANVWTTDIRKMLQMAEALDCGVVWGNSAMLMDPALAYGGTKSSGIGRASGREAIDGMTRTKRVSVRYLKEAPIPAWQDLD